MISHSRLSREGCVLSPEKKVSQHKGMLSGLIVANSDFNFTAVYNCLSGKKKRLKIKERRENHQSIEAGLVDGWLQSANAVNAREI